MVYTISLHTSEKKDIWNIMSESSYIIKIINSIMKCNYVANSNINILYARSTLFIISKH